MIRKQIDTLLLMVAYILLFAACTPREIQLHAVRLTDDNGTSPIATVTPGHIETWVTAANDVYDFANYTFLFDPDEDISDVKNTLLNTVPPVGDVQGWEDYRIAGSFLALWAYPDKGVVYFRGRDGLGFSWGPEGDGATAFVSMPFYTNTAYVKGAPNNGLLAHELGHYLGLVHTFPEFSCDDCDPCDLVTPANANADVNGMYATEDDNVGDTNADPRADCAPTTSLNCPGGTVVVNGSTFDPPWTNVMSYHACFPLSVSLDQIKAINRTMEHPWRAPIRR
jgi:hypothetical protein